MRHSTPFVLLVLLALSLMLNALLIYHIAVEHIHYEGSLGMKPAYAAELNVINLTDAHEWTQGRHKHDPPCGDPRPCVGDFHGTRGPDLIRGNGGWDWGFLGGSDDIFYGGPGMDQPYGASGNDELYGEAGHDHEWGGGGDDLMVTADGNDESGHIEEAHGGFGKDVEPGFDKCIMDEDEDGVAVTDCDVLILEAVAGVSGPTPLYRNGMAFDDGRTPVGSLPGPGTYRDVNP